MSDDSNSLPTYQLIQESQGAENQAAHNNQNQNYLPMTTSYEPISKSVDVEPSHQIYSGNNNVHPSQSQYVQPSNQMYQPPQMNQNNQPNYQNPNVNMNVNLNMGMGMHPQQQNYPQNQQNQNFNPQSQNKNNYSPPQTYQPSPNFNNPGVYSPQQQVTHTTVTASGGIPQPPPLTTTHIIVTGVGPNVCGNEIPILDPGTALVVLILNIFFPGIGTMITGCVGRNANVGAWFCLGFLQLILLFCLIGWIWSIITGIQVLTRSNEPRTVTLL